MKCAITDYDWDETRSIAKQFRALDARLARRTGRLEALQCALSYVEFYVDGIEAQAAYRSAILALIAGERSRLEMRNAA